MLSCTEDNSNQRLRSKITSNTSKNFVELMPTTSGSDIIPIGPTLYKNYFDFHVLTYTITSFEWQCSENLSNSVHINLTFSSFQIDSFCIGKIKVFIQMLPKGNWKVLPLILNDNKKHYEIKVDSMSNRAIRINLNTDFGPNLVPTTCRIKLLLISKIMLQKYYDYDWDKENKNDSIVDKNRVARRSFLDLNFLLSR